MGKYRDLIIKTIEKTDETFDLIGRKYQKTPTIIVVEGLSYTSFHITGAILLLCENNFNQEATILLRSLIENTINLKWILHEDSDNRIRNYFRDISDKGFGSKWAGDKNNLKKRLLDVGLTEEYYNKVVKITHSFSHTNAESLDWRNLKPDFPLFSDEAILSVTYQMLGHTIEILNEYISQEFSYYKEIFEKFDAKKT